MLLLDATFMHHNCADRRAPTDNLLVEVHITAADANSAHQHPDMARWDVCRYMVVLIAQVICAVQNGSGILHPRLLLHCMQNIQVVP